MLEAEELVVVVPTFIFQIPRIYCKITRTSGSGQTSS